MKDEETTNFNAAVPIDFLGYGQSNLLETAEIQQLNSDTLAKCIFLDREYQTDEQRAHEVVWGLKSVRDLTKGLLTLGTHIETLTVTLEKPTNKSSYFIIGLYNRQPRTINKLMMYRVEKNSYRIERRYDEKSEWTLAVD